MIMQMPQGKLQPDIHLMGLRCDPAELLQYAEGTEVSVTRRPGNTR